MGPNLLDMHMTFSAISSTCCLPDHAQLPGRNAVEALRRSGGVPYRLQSLAAQPVWQHLGNGLFLLAVVSLLLSAGRAIAGALRDPLLGVVGTSLLVATIGALVASVRKPRRAPRRR